MQKIPLNLAKPGYVLAKPVSRADGMVVAPQGVEITQTLLNKLEMLEVGNVVVEGSPVHMDGVVSGTSYDQRLLRLDHLFRKHAGNPWMLKVKGQLVAYFQRKVAGRSAG